MNTLSRDDSHLIAADNRGNTKSLGMLTAYGDMAQGNGLSKTVAMQHQSTTNSMRLDMAEGRQVINSAHTKSRSAMRKRKSRFERNPFFTQGNSQHELNYAQSAARLHLGSND